MYFESSIALEIRQLCLQRQHVGNGLVLTLQRPLKLPAMVYKCALHIGDWTYSRAICSRTISRKNKSSKNSHSNLHQSTIVAIDDIC